VNLSDILEVMIETDCSREQIAAVVKAFKEKRSSGAVRQARYRARLKEKSVTSDVTGDVTGDVTSGSPEVPPKNNIKPLPTPSQKHTISRASRLPKGWEPKDWGSMEKFGARFEFTRTDLDRELEAFSDYWHAKAGANGTKLDWDATLRTWLRNASQRRRGGSGSNGSLAVSQREKDLAAWQAQAAKIEREAAEEEEQNREQQNRDVEGETRIFGHDDKGKVRSTGGHTGPFGRGTTRMWGTRVEERGVVHHSDPEISYLADCGRDNRSA
jgi:hypothetical protein